MIFIGFHWIGSGRRPTPPAGGPLIFEVLAATGTRVTFATSRHSARLTPPRRSTLVSLSRAHCPSSRRQIYFAKWARQRRRLAERSGRVTFLFGPGLNSHTIMLQTDRDTHQILHRTPSAKHTRAGAHARGNVQSVRTAAAPPPHSNEAAAARARARRASEGAPAGGVQILIFGEM